MKRITINKAIDKFKKEKFTNIPINENLISDTLIDTDKLNIPLQTILNTVQELPSQYRFVFNLYELYGYTHKEISKLLTISVGTSKSNLHRAKAILKKKIENINPKEN